MSFERQLILFFFFIILFWGQKPRIPKRAKLTHAAQNLAVYRLQQSNNVNTRAQMCAGEVVNTS